MGQPLSEGGSKKIHQKSEDRSKRSLLGRFRNDHTFPSGANDTISNTTKPSLLSNKYLPLCLKDIYKSLHFYRMNSGCCTKLKCTYKLSYKICIANNTFHSIHGIKC